MNAMNILNAIKNGNLNTVKELAIDVNMIIDGNEILYHAVANNQLEIVNYLLQQGASINLKYHYDPLLHVAVASDNFDIVFILLEYGAYVFERDGDLMRPHELTYDNEMMHMLETNMDIYHPKDNLGYYDLVYIPTFELIKFIKKGKYLDIIDKILGEREYINVNYLVELFNLNLSSYAIYNIANILFSLQQANIRKIIDICIRYNIHIPFEIIYRILHSDVFSEEYKRRILFNNYPNIQTMIEGILHRENTTIGKLPKEILYLVLGYVD